MSGLLMIHHPLQVVDHRQGYHRMVQMQEHLASIQYEPNQNQQELIVCEVITENK